MLFWMFSAALAFAVAAWLALTMFRAHGPAAAARDFDMAVYRDQLTEIERDLGRGVITESEATRIRTEVSRRLLEADRAATAAATATTTTAAPRAATRGVAAIAVLLILGGALALYDRLGAPGFPDLPLSRRISDAENFHASRASQVEAEALARPPTASTGEADPKLLELIVRLRAMMRDRPDDLQGQILLARNEAVLGNYRAAHLAQARVVALKGEMATAGDFADLAELMFLAANGYVSPEAETALYQALRRDSRDGTARYYIGLMHVQTGRPDLAFGVWRQLLEESRPEAPWVPPITAQIESVAEMAGVRFSLPEAAPTPSAEDVRAAGEMSAEERSDMIRGMVGRLSERLATEGGSPEEWARLITAYGVLGETSRAAETWTRAQSVFADAPQALATVRAAAERSGLPE